MNLPRRGLVPEFIRSEFIASAQEPERPRVSADGSFESDVVRIDLNGASLVERSVYITERRWSGCDVYLELGPPFAPAIIVEARLTVRVYAIGAGGGRTLVATGRHVSENSTGTQGVWICAVRGGAERFEVTLTSTDYASSVSYANVRVFAANDLPPADPIVGTVSFQPLGEISTANQLARNDTSSKNARIVGIQATQLVAGPRYLLIVDTQSAALVGGESPTFSFGFVAGVGQPIRMPPNIDRLFASRGFQSGIGVAISSTGNVVTLGAAGDVAWSVWFR